MKLLLSVVLMMPFLSGAAAAQNDAVMLSVALSVEALPMGASKNVFTIRVSKPKPDKVPVLYDIVFYIDGRYENAFRRRALPLEFPRNLRGHGAGAHELRIDVLDPGGETVRGRKSITVQVQP